MAKKASTAGDASKKSTATSSSRRQKSSILKSAFAPCAYQLDLFASVIQAFDCQHLRIHDFNNGRLQCNHRLGAGTRINSLDWGFYGPDFRDQNEQKPKRKRKRDHESREFIAANAKNAVVALGTSNSDVQMFSPAKGKVVGKLSGIHERGVNDFRFVSGDCLWGWSIGGDGRVAQWNLKSNQAVRTVSLPDANISILGPPRHQQPQLLCASSTPYALDFVPILDFEQAEPSTTSKFDSFKHPIHTIIRSGKDKLHDDESMLAVDTGRYINVFDIAQRHLVRTLVTSSEAISLAFFDHAEDQAQSFSNQQLSVVTQDGLVELFSSPFLDTSDSDASRSMKAKRKNMTRKANATVKLIRPDSTGSAVPVFETSFQGLDLIIAWVEGGINLFFEKIKWADSKRPGLLLAGTKEIFITKKISTFSSGVAQDSKHARNSNVDESHAIIANGSMAEGGSEEAAIALSGDEDDERERMEEDSLSESGDVTEQEDEEAGNSSTAPAALANGVDESQAGDSDVEMGEMAQRSASGELDEEVEIVEPSFGDLLVAKTTQPISIADALSAAESGALVPTESSKPIAIPFGISLSTVLTQALRTNDNNLLESCFHNTDTQIIRSTVQRLHSSLAGVLIQKLAERLSSRPGRYGHLLVWVQWICVAHGGAIGGQPDVLSKVRTLYKVLNQRSKALDSLLLLKGKLDMLDAQLGLRKQLLDDRGPVRDPQEGHVIYVEGEELSDSSDEDVAFDASGTMGAPSSKSGGRKNLDELVPNIEEESEDDEDMPMTNGVVAETHESDFDSEEDEEGPMQQREGGLVDNEAEDSDEDSHPSDREEDLSEEEGSSGDDEEDSEMEDFIDDGPIEVESASEISVDADPERPITKKSRHH